jgi:hypothetical protein
LEKNKADLEIFKKFEETANLRIIELENGIDSVLDKTNSLENWIDVYMPLRIQH